MQFSLILLGCLLLVASTYGAPKATSLQCRDESGAAVDWYIVYKFPYIVAKHDRVLFSGYNYAYQTSATTAEEGWHLSNQTITDPQRSIFARTLNPILATAQKDYSTVFYSDQPPTDENPSASYAHAKGVVASNSKTGFWLIHTVPNFAPANISYVYPLTGGRYGQVALCISLSATEITKVVESFRVAKVFTFSHTTPSDSPTPLKTAITRLAASNWTASETKHTDQVIKSLAGQEFRSFYKSPNEHVDLYDSIVAPGLHSSLYVETWRREPGTPLASACELTTKVENIDELQLAFKNSPQVGTFDYLEDHSKWAVTEQQAGGAVCVGDMNRMQSQWKRGGGTTCLARTAVWKSFHDMVAKFEKCGV